MRRIVTSGRVLMCVCGLGAPFACGAAEHSPPLMHAQSYAAEEAIEIARYWVSEKLDGVRAYWNGTQLVTRAGHVIAAPAWFTNGWPATPMDGELWGGRGTFERTSGTARSGQANDVDWRRVSYRVFDLPKEPDTFDKRLVLLQEVIARADIDWLAAVQQERLDHVDQLHAKLQAVEAVGGEGLMLHRGDSLYVAARTDDLLKYKSFDDAEAKVVGYVPGHGKFLGMMGALVVERADGARFKIGSGFSEAERRQPPLLGSWITYAYNGATNSGLPRFARFLRARLSE